MKTAIKSAGEIDNDLVVCRCAGVLRSEIAAQAKLVNGDVEAICQSTGAGVTCGGCIPIIGEIAGRTRMGRAELVDKIILDCQHAAFRFKVEEELLEGLVDKPCQDTLLETWIGGRPLSRSYTITSSCRDKLELEIIVRREPNGLVSRWLHDTANNEHFFRLSAPFGGISKVKEDRIVFAAAGIGITPALAWLRHRAFGGDGAERCLVHWWNRAEADSGLVKQLEAAIDGARTAGVDVEFTRSDTRCTTSPRLSRSSCDLWLSHVLSVDRDLIHVCGPQGFMDLFVIALDCQDWPKEQRVLASFISSPGAGAALASEQASHYRVERFDFRTDPIVANGFTLDSAASPERLLCEAEAFLRQYYFEEGAETSYEIRIDDIQSQIESTGTYSHTQAELSFGARLAWRNSARCIGRFFWQSLTVRDRRILGEGLGEAQLAHTIFEDLLEHIRFATNGGDIRAALTVFRPRDPEIRILNPQLILYAGHRNSDGTFIGDPKNVELTELAKALGWQPSGTCFDVLPLMIRIGTSLPYIFEIPKSEILEVELHHPDETSVASLGLKWFALPAVSDMALDLGGITYSAAPSNGFYMGTEIGSFNIADPQRYAQLENFAHAMNLDTSEVNPLWRDQAMVEINRSVLHSFRCAGVRILDHHALSEWFRRFREDEEQQSRPVYGHWPWIVPPMSANLSHIWHDTNLKKVMLKPGFFYQNRKSAIRECLEMISDPSKL
ncbi:nitric oxide synthase oxygenase [Tritonibacter mobilis]|uniref:nitric oxide synthase oxygenase n=1 Tax=Tritonibacter mobilis TaxID=379347 RepID=UPI0039A6F159